MAAGGAGFGLLGESPGDGERILKVRKTVRTGPSLVMDKVISIRRIFWS